MEIKSYGSSAILIHEGSSCVVSMHYGELYLHSLITDEEFRGKGSATRVLTEAKRLSRKMKRPLVLNASPFADRPMTYDQLVEFYKSRGFINSEYNKFIYWSN